MGGLGLTETLTARSEEHSPPPSEQTLGESLSDQHCSVPVSKKKSSTMCKDHVPLTAKPDLPLRVERNCCGRNVPTYGGDPERIEILALSSNVVRLESGAQPPP